MIPRPVIHVIDDDSSFRAAVSRLLRVAGHNVAHYDSASSFLKDVANAEPGCILLDVQMPTITGLQLQDQLAELAHTWPIIFMTGHGDIPTSVRAIKAGADDFLCKPISSEILLGAVERAMTRFEEIRTKSNHLNSLRVLVAKLTPREHEVFILIVHGKLNKQIAHELGTSERTVKAHRHVVKQKLQAQSFAEVVSIAERVGLLTPSSQAETRKVE